MIKKTKKINYYIIGVVFLMGIIGLFIFLNIQNDKAVWNLLDRYDDSLTNCSLQASSLFNNGKFESAQIQIILCQSIINEALTEINGFERESSDTNIKVAKLDYKNNLDYINMINLLIDVKLGDFLTTQEALGKLSQAKKLAKDILSYYDNMFNLYSSTLYYKRYYESKDIDVQQYKQTITDLNSQIQEILDYYNNLECQSGYVLGDDYQCHKTCESSTKYCSTGTCCNNKCLSCSDGYYLATDCKCYQN